MRELVRPPHIADDVEFYTAIYERQTSGHPREWPMQCGHRDFKASYVFRTGGMRISKSVKRTRSLHLYPRRLLPKRGDSPVPAFLTAEVLGRRRPLFIKRASFNLLGEHRLSILARPVIWYGRIAKIIVVGVGEAHRSLLEKQVKNLKQPLVVQGVAIT